MPFPLARRVIYRKNPLERVICQLRFPPILRIDAELPAQFQERVRGEFPNYLESSELKIELPTNLKMGLSPEVASETLRVPTGKNYEFSSEDGSWKVNLTRGFVALSAARYERWEAFRAKLMLPLQALVEVYSPSYFSRVGLRYVDVIRRSNLNLQEAAWSDLFQPYVLGILASVEVGDSVVALESRHDVRLSDGDSVVRILMRLAEAADTGEIAYMIDSDFFNSRKTETADVIEKLDFFSARGTRLFQWCITERLHQAMEPQPL